MRILYLHQYFTSPEQSGGTRSYEVARRLVARGHEVTMLTSNAMFPSPTDKTTRTVVAGIDVVALPVAYRSRMSAARRIVAFADFAARATAWATRTRCDVVFASSTPLTIAVPGLVAAARWRTPFVFEVRDLWPDLPIAVGALRSPVLKGLARALERVAYRYADEVVALSEGMAAGVRARKRTAGCVSVIPNGCDVAAFDVDREEARDYTARLIPGSGPLVVYAGSFGAMNDVGWLVDLAHATARVAPHVRFALVGDGPERDVVMRRAKAVGVLDRNLFVRPPIPKTEVPLLLAGASLAMSVFQPLAQMEHNSANKFFDGLAAGVPVAINYGGWQAALLRDSGAGLVLARSPADAAARLQGALDDPTWCTQAGRAARALACSRFSRDAQVDALADVLERAVRGRRSAPR